jgi:hypothetical protein
MFKLYEWALVRSQTLVRKMQGQPPQDSTQGRGLPMTMRPSVIPIGDQQGTSAASEADHVRKETARTNGPEKLTISVGQDTPTSTVPDDIPPLVEDAIHLIVYLTGSGDNPRPETVSAVFTAKKAIQEGAWSIEIGRKFLEAFSELAKQAKPVTARSLLESESKRAKSSINRWSLVVWALLPILVILSALSYSNSRFATNAEQLIQLSYQVEQPGFVPPVPRADSTGAPQGRTQGIGPPLLPLASAQAALDDARAQAHLDAIRETTGQLFVNGQMLVKLSLMNLFFDISDLDDVFDSDKQRAGQGEQTINAIKTLGQTRAELKVITTMDGIAFGVLNTYILPLLCAVLGAAAYGLRSLSEQTFARTYRSTYAAFARAILAVIVGFAVGLFTDFTAKLSIQPLAVAFIAGYAAESIFIFLDTILQAIQKPRTAAT